MTTQNMPLSVAQVALTVNDLDRVGSFYRDIIGLEPLLHDGETMRLGKDGATLIELRRDTAARPQPRGAGLFHTAFLLPDRADLGRWLRHAAQTGTPLDGASDHLVSEALYLRDPEGNGIEIYADRPRETWKIDAGGIRMDTVALNLRSLMADATEPWLGAPAGTVIGHVHLQVGDIGLADAFYTGALGMARMAQLPSASFYATGGYHHHLAANVWNSRGTGRRSPEAAGLAELTLRAGPDRAASLERRQLDDPWGNRISITTGS